MRQDHAESYLESSDTDIISPSENESNTSVKHTNITDNNQAQPSCKSSLSKRQKSIHSCKFCTFTCTRQDAFDRHEFKHTKIKKFPCTEPGCERHYTNRAHLKRHQKTTHQRNDSTEQEQSKPSGSNKLSCQHIDCSRMFANKYAMMRHYKSVHSGCARQFKCHHCTEIFQRKAHLKVHMFQHTQQYPYTCHICGVGFLNQKLARHHSVTHRAYHCQQCPEIFSKWSALQVHRRIHDTSGFKCGVCEKSFTTRSNMMTHMTNIHSDPDQRKVFQCPEENCPKFYVQMNGLKKHIRRKHTDGSNRMEFECSYCGLKLSSKQKITFHLLKFHRDGTVEKPKKKPMRKPQSTDNKKRTKLSTASKLTGVQVIDEIEKSIFNGAGHTVELLYSSAISESDDAEENVVSKTID